MHVSEYSVVRFNYQNRILTFTSNSLTVSSESSCKPLPLGIACKKFMIATSIIHFIQNDILHFPTNE